MDEEEVRTDGAKPLSDAGDAIIGDSGSRHGDESCPRSLRKQPPRKSPAALECPVCGLTLRPHDLQQHYEVEVERLGRISKSGSRRSGDGLRSGTAAQSLRRVRANRSSRRRRLRDTANGFDAEESTQCPVCQETIEGSSEVVADHVDACLRHSEESGSGNFEEYEWAGQSRVRASSLLEGGFGAAGLARRSREDEDDDLELDVDGDDEDTYGGPQYSEADVVPLPVDTGERAPRSPAEEDGRRTDATQSDEASAGGSRRTVAPSGPLVEEALRERMRQLDNPHARCLVCLEPYREPAVSVCCWHVYCKDCWLHTLGAKKLCPQCNSITSPADLRRIYL